MCHANTHCIGTPRQCSLRRVPRVFTSSRNIRHRVHRYVVSCRHPEQSSTAVFVHALTSSLFPLVLLRSACRCSLPVICSLRPPVVSLLSLRPALLGQANSSPYCPAWANQLCLRFFTRGQDPFFLLLRVSLSIEHRLLCERCNRPRRARSGPVSVAHPPPINSAYMSIVFFPRIPFRTPNTRGEGAPTRGAGSSSPPLLPCDT